MSTPTTSLGLATAYLNRRVTLRVDRPAGSRHPLHGYLYPVNYGYLPGVPAPDGDDLDAYYLTTTPVDQAEGVCIAVIHRHNDDDDKIVVVDEDDTDLTDNDIHRLVAFQELRGQYDIVRERAGTQGRQRDQLGVPAGTRQDRHPGQARRCGAPEAPCPTPPPLRDVRRGLHRPPARPR
ncbi:MAG: inorganic diphosphatase [Pseudonocardiaceae bacterium]